METPDVQIEPSWKEVLKEEFSKPYFATLVAFLKHEKAQGQTIYPPGKLIFNAYALTPFDKVKAVLLGQDPYHGYGQAQGLAFSVPQGIATPPSLVNIYKEMRDDIGYTIPNHGNLEHWAREGILLLNTVLTVRAGQANSHKGKGWEQFTDATIRAVSERKDKIVFLLWGKPAQSKAPLIDASKHLILTAAHPSPMAQGAFFGCKHFSKTNEYLLRNGIEPIKW
jgi:uracil-DNA glycosylase